LARCRANVAEFNVRPPVPYVGKPRREESVVEHRIVLHGVAIREFDAHPLVRLAKQLIRDGYTTDR
jgi:hypothetical protein